MLKHRLLFGTLMVLFFVGLVLLDGYLDGSMLDSAQNKPVQGTLLCILLVLLAIPAQLELAKLAAVKNIKIFKSVTIVASMLLVSSWYWPQLFNLDSKIYLTVLMAFTLLSLMVYQHKYFQITNVMVNCGANLFAIMYIGGLSLFVLAVRIDFGMWHLLMFVFTVKASDIGAYTIGRIFGKHKFSPVISPKKTWEGMGGAVLFAIIAAVLFAYKCDIMYWLWAVLFGICFAFIGQLGDLAESMIKRDAEQKDSASNVPGFGGILDIIDSPLVAAVFAYLFFMFVSK